MARTLLTAIFLTLLSQTAWADSRLDDQDDKILAAQCSKARPSHKSEYAYYPAKVVSIGTNGANITQVVRRKFWKTTGGNNGWGKEKKHTEYLYIKCYWHNVKKGDYNNPPAYALNYFDKGKKPWMKAYAERQYTNVFGELRTKRALFNFDGDFEQSTLEYTYHFDFWDEALKVYDSLQPVDFGLWTVDGHQ